MSKILITYATMAGSTEEVARAVGEEIAKGGFQVDVLPVSQVKDLGAYNAVVVGAPMIRGYHRDALKFLKKHRADLGRIPFAVFVTAISLTKTGETRVDDVPVFVDEKLPKEPARPGKLSFKERYARLPNYLRPILKASRPQKPASIAVFGGRLEFGRLKWWAILFVALIVGAAPGDRRNWDAVRRWAAGLPAAFDLETSALVEEKQVA